MKRKKKMIYAPTEDWKEVIGFDIDKEFQIYRYLCGNLRNRRKINKIDKEKLFGRYKSWREYVEGNLAKYDIETLNEFFHFLKLEEMKCNINKGMDASHLIPFVVTFIAGGLVQCIFEIYGKGHFSIDFEYIYQQISNGIYGVVFACIGIIIMVLFAVIGLLFCVAMIMIPFLLTMKLYVRSKYMMAFWHDYLKITKVVIKEKKNEKVQEMKPEE